MTKRRAQPPAGRSERAGLEGHREVQAHGRTCALCRQRRERGQELATSPDKPTATAWVCTDCQQKLARKVDDEGVPGG